MLECSKKCFTKEKRDKVISKFIKIYPILWIFLKAIFTNTIVQVLFLLLVGSLLLSYGIKSNSQAMQTIAITIISASIFKFLLTANAFATLVSKIVRESFLEKDFMEALSDEKIKNLMINSIQIHSKKNFDLIENQFSNFIIEALDSFTQGYYSNLCITIQNNIDTNGYIITKSTYAFTCYSSKKEIVNNEFEFSLGDNNYTLQKILINGIDITRDVKCECNQIEPKKLSYCLNLEAGENKIIIEESYKGEDPSHEIHFNKVTTNVKVSYKHDDNIINPVLINKYGEFKETKSLPNHIYRDFGKQIFLPGEFIFIKFQKKETR